MNLYSSPTGIKPCKVLHKNKVHKTLSLNHSRTVSELLTKLFGSKVCFERSCNVFWGKSKLWPLVLGPLASIAGAGELGNVQETRNGVMQMRELVLKRG